MSDFLYELKNIEQYHDDKRVLKIDYLSLKSNQIIGFFGPNGSGKSTLFSLLSFINKPSEGEIFYKGIAQSRLDFKVKQDIVIVPQNPYLLKRTVFENVAYGLRIRKNIDNLEQKVYEALNLVGLNASFSKRKWSQLSGGEAQRVSLAARLILKPKVLILDEPTSGVDTNSAQLIKEAILSAKQKYNTSIFISSHDHNWLNHVCDTKVALFQGQLIESGSVNLLFAPWEKEKNGNLVKVFNDNQALCIENTETKKRDSVLVIDSKDISICPDNCSCLQEKSSLKGVVDSISQVHSKDELLVEFSVSSVNFNCKISKEEMYEYKLLPGDKINVHIDLHNICFI